MKADRDQAVDDEHELFDSMTEEELAGTIEWKSTPIELRVARNAGLISLAELKSMRRWDKVRARAELISRAEASEDERFLQFVRDIAAMERRLSWN